MTVAVEIKVGLLSLIGEVRGGHVHVTVRGEGDLGSRPLCGHFIASDEEWRSLARLGCELSALHKELARETAARGEAVDAIDRMTAKGGAEP